MLIKAAAGLVLGLVAFVLVRLVLFDFLTVWIHQVTRENSADKRVLITGSSRGIGESLAYVYAEAGAHVTLHARKVSSLEKVSEKCRQLGAASVHSVAGDMSVAGSAASIVTQAAAAMGGLDIVVVNHIAPTDFTTLAATAKQMRSGQLQSAMRTNFFSYVETADASLQHLDQSSGSLVLVSSAAGQLPIPYCYEYCFSKRALHGLASALRQELAINGSSVHVGIAVLGLIATEAAKEAVPRYYKTPMEFASPDSTARAIAAMPLARIGELVTPWHLRIPLLLRNVAGDFIEQQLQALSQHL